jgi:LacI family transcriptional regulator
MRAIEDELSAAGYSPLFASGRWDTAEETRCAEMLCSRRVDGMIVLNARLSDEALRELAHRIPVVVSGRSLSGPHLYSLDFDHFEGARIAADHLLSLGHRRIAFICGDPIHADSIERLRGYRAALEASGVPYNPALVLQGDYRESSGLAATERLLDSKEPFTAIFAANDQMAFGAALALYRRGLRVPDDVSLIGIDDLPAAANAIPPLTTIHQGAYDMGRLAAASLLQLLRGAEPMGTLPPPSLVRRSSTKKFP